MRHLSRYLWIILLWHLALAAQNEVLEHNVQHAAISADLANAISQIAYAARVPFVAELAQPLPRIQLSAGSDTLHHLLGAILRQAPGYAVEVQGPIIHIYSRKLKGAKYNFLDRKFSRFTVPANLSMFKLAFPGYASGLLNARPTTGAALSGFSDEHMEKRALKRVTLENVTAREVLFQVMNQSPTFFTVLVFPSATPKAKREALQTTVNWFWQTFDGKLVHFYVQPSKTAG